MTQIKKRYLIFIAISILMSSSVKCSEASFKLASDKINHIVVSAIIYDTAYLYCENQGLSKSSSFWYATLATTAAGLLKEKMDDVFDHDDLLADSIGWGIGIALIEIEF